MVGSPALEGRASENGRLLGQAGGVPTSEVQEPMWNYAHGIQERIGIESPANEQEPIENGE
jgi:hypothetical protein